MAVERERRARRLPRLDDVPSPEGATDDGERTAAPFVPNSTSIRMLTDAAQACRGCDLYKHATQAVFGAGAKSSLVMFIGEQPGDQEDKQGQPFVGPAGALLDKALAEAGIPRTSVYVTNAVKHFKWEPRGKRRIHKKPRWSEIKACRPWLDAELRAVKPKIVVCLGSTAAQSVFGSTFKLMQQRGRPLPSALASHVVATIHPSSVLRAPDPEGRRAAFDMLVADLKVVAQLMGR